MTRHSSMPRIIGSLIHAMVHTRPDIAFAVSLLSRTMADPQPYHYKACKYLLCYLRDTQDKCLIYRQAEMIRSAPHFLEALVDSSFADCDDTARSTSGFVVTFGGAPVEWESKRQGLVTLSTMESEYVAASKCVCSIRYLRKLFYNFFKIPMTRDPVVCWEDNAACIAISHAPPGVHRSRSKHIAVKYHNVREACEAKEVVLSQIWTEHQVADIFTKSLQAIPFLRFRKVLLGEVSLNDMMQQHVKPEPAPKPMDIHFVGYEPNYWHSWPSRSVPIQSCSLVANLMGMKPYHLTGYETGYDSESSYSGYDVNDRVGFNGSIAVGAR